MTEVQCRHHLWSIYLLHHSYQRNKAVGDKTSGIVVIIIIGLCCIWNITAEALAWVPGLVEKLLSLKILPLDACECGPAGQGKVPKTSLFEGFPYCTVTALRGDAMNQSLDLNQIDRKIADLETNENGLAP